MTREETRMLAKAIFGCNVFTLQDRDGFKFIRRDLDGRGCIEPIGSGVTWMEALLDGVRKRDL